jgi:hypothetical protein
LHIANGEGFGTTVTIELLLVPGQRIAARASVAPARLSLSTPRRDYFPMPPLDVRPVLTAKACPPAPAGAHHARMRDGLD